MEESAPLDPNLNSHRSVRRNLFRALEHRIYTSYTLLLFSILIHLGKLMAGCYILSTQPHDCQTPLYLWNLVSLLLDSVYLGLKAIRMPYIKRAREGEDIDEVYSLQIAFVAQAVLYVIWQLPGNVWMWSCDDCLSETPALWGLSLSNLILAYLYMLVPAIILVSVCACLPVAIVFVMMISGNGQSPASERLINSLESETYDKQIHVGDPACTICATDYEEEDMVTVMQCDQRHFYHTECIKRWLRINANCPICRAPYVLD
jgi:hypothetical protein